MSLVQYLTGTALVALAAGSAGYAAWHLRRALLPGWTGAAARLVEVVTAVGLTVGVAELLGLAGLIRPWTLVPALAVVALLVHRLVPVPGAADPEVHSVPPAPAVPGGYWPWIAAITVAFLLLAQWGAFIAQNLDQGITNFDSVWYHLPYATEIARTGSVTYFPHTETVFTNWFYPQNSELIHAVGISLTGRDFLSLFLNTGWLGLALLAGWCVGRPYGRPHLTMIAAAIALATHTLVVREPGTAKNDAIAIALILAGVAILVNRGAASKDGHGRIGPGWAVAAAGLAVGLAAGTKVTALAPAAMMTLVVAFAALPGSRIRTLGTWLGAMAAGGGWWYLRNLFATGNPIPQMEHLGPIPLPGPERLQIGRPDFAVAHYLSDTAVWREYFIPGLEQGFGRLWPVLLAVAVIGAAGLLVRGSGRLARAFGGAALLALAAYLFTPLGAAGPEGHPTAFAINLRFLAPALAMTIVLVPLLPWFDPGRRARTILGVGFVVLFLATWYATPLLTTSGAVFGLFLATVFLLVPALAWIFRDRLPSPGPGFLTPPGYAVIACATLFILTGWPLSQRYFDNRYGNFEPEGGLAPAYRWANDTRDRRIGLAGTTAGFKSFGFFGSDLSNRVIYLGRPGPRGAFNAIPTCRAFVTAVNAADLDFLVTSPYLNFHDYRSPKPSPEKDWIRSDPALSPVVVNRRVEVWKVDGRLNPDRCGRRGAGADWIPGRAGA